jgi:hypothetical protein
VIYGTNNRIIGEYENKEKGIEDTIDDRSLFCFLKKCLQPGTLDKDITDSECSFIMKLIDQSNKGKVNYEE